MSKPPPFEQPSPPHQQQTVNNQVVVQQTNGIGTAALVLSLIGIVLPICAVIGLICGLIGMFFQPRGNAIAGFIISLVIIVGWVLLWVLVIGTLGLGCLGLANIGLPFIQTQGKMLEMQTEMVEFYEANDRWPSHAEFDGLFGDEVDGWDQPFSLELEGNSATIVSNGPDTISGTSDDIRSLTMDGDNLPDPSEFRMPDDYDPLQEGREAIPTPSDNFPSLEIE